MGTATLTAAGRRNVALFSQTYTQGVSFKMFRKQEPGKPETLIIENMPVFRAGVFRDSMGYQHTWEDIHMQHMVEHFTLLADRGVLEHVPVRKGHNGFFDTGASIMDSIVGYHTALRTERMVNKVDGVEYNYLLADYEIVDADAMVAIESGKWRNMSAEVGSWLTNDEAEFWPVYRGVAYVDFSAVEGLKNFASANGVGSSYSVMASDKELQVSAPLPPAPAGTPTPGQQAQGTPPTQQAAPTFEFTVGGRKTTDFAAVQAQLNVLETFRDETIKSRRTEFAKSLASGNKIVQDDVSKIEKFALGLSNEQFEDYKAQWDAAPVLPQLGNHAAGTSNHSGNQPAGSAPTEGQAPSEVDNAKDIVASFAASGMTQEQIKATGSYKILAAAGCPPF